MNKTDIRKPRRHLVAAACLTALMGATGAQAVQVASEGLGQVLIYPYYTVQPDASGAAYDTYISIVNVTTASKAIKVRFLEGRNGREVMDFNLYLSPHDTWAAAITQAPGGGARMVFNDKSCIQPVTYKGTAVDFYSKNYTGANADGGDPSILRTREGWVEVYEMGVVSNTLLQAAMKQDSNGEPPACNAFDAASASQFSMPTGGLMGQVNLINVKTGGSYNYDAVALTDFFGAPLWTKDGQPSPSLADAKTSASVVSSSGFALKTSKWAQGYQAVTAALQSSTLSANFNADSAVKATTDLVVVQPTKRFHTAPGAILSPFSADGCDPVTVKTYSREGLESTNSTALCNSLNVISFGTNGKVFNSTYATVWTVPYENGFSNINPLQSNVSTDATPYTHVGLPMLGFQVSNFNNGTLTDGAGKAMLANYGFNFNVRRTVTVTP